MAHSYDDLIAAIVELTTIFENRHLKYVLIGGLAVSQLTQPRFTKDVDFLIEVPQLQLPGVLEDIVAKGGDLDLIPSISLEHQSYVGVSVQWYSCRLAQAGNSCLLTRYHTRYLN